MSKVFQKVGGLRPGRSAFDLSYEQKLTCDMGQLIPIMCDEVVPGDYFKIGNEIVIRFQPMLAPIMHQVDVFVHYFYVPYRLLWDDWEEFITRGADGDQALTIPTAFPAGGINPGDLWDYLGMPTGVVLPADNKPMLFPVNAYNMIWNEYYRDQNLQNERSLTDASSVARRAWMKDYFTSALPWTQRGTAPALPISGTTSAVFGSDIETKYNFVGQLENYEVSSDNQGVMTFNRIGTPGTFTPGSGNSIEIDNADLNTNTVDLSVASTFDINDLRQAWQIQKWMERNARAGVRYTEFLKAHFGVAPSDSRLDRPEYIGGNRAPVIVSEVLQTSSTDATTPQGNMAGHGLAVNRSYVASYKVQEYGLIMGIMSVMPKPAYQQGIDRQWLRKTAFDFYFPEFAHLGEQPIQTMELYATNSKETNETIFGYQQRFAEMRHKRSQVHGLLRSDLDFWHLGRIFDSPPGLNSDFITCNPDKRIFAVPSEPGLIVSFGNKIKAIRPLPVISEPGLVDHF